MKLNPIEIDILSVLTKKELDRLQILNELEKKAGRCLPLSNLYTALTHLKSLELISGRWDRSPGLFGGSVEFYSVTETGYRIIKSLKRTG